MGQPGILTGDTRVSHTSPKVFLVVPHPSLRPAGNMKLEFLENRRSTLLGYLRISNLFQAHFWDFPEIACWHWPDLREFKLLSLD